MIQARLRGGVWPDLYRGKPMMARLVAEQDARKTAGTEVADIVTRLVG
ncbi:MAG: hypothetical protein RL094_574 [Candidatus Parcubacteria bacterium]|jgi:hypothetical protein